MIPVLTSCPITPGRYACPSVNPIPTTASIILVNYNGRRDLAPCLDSLHATLSAGCEILLVDNNSNDDSVAFVRATYADVRIIESAVNLGFGGGNNLAVREANGEFLVFLNPDTVVSAHWLETLLHPLETNPDIGMTTARVMLLDQLERVNACGNDTHFTGLTLCRGMNQPAERYNEDETVGAVSGAAFAMRRRDFEALGGFDETMFLYMEDTDLSWRVRLAGYRCVCVAKSIVYHDYQLSFGARKTYYQEYHRYIMLLKCLRWATLLALIPALLLSEGITWGFVLVYDQRNIKNKLHAYRAVYQNWSIIKTLRTQVQASRRVTDHQMLIGFTHHIDFQQANQGLAGLVASRLLNPLFFLYHQFLLAVIR